jgi:hypothetical protein
MAYGWSPKQMARVNARRQARGQEQLEFRPRSERAATQYAEEYEEYGRRKGIGKKNEKPQVAGMEEERKLGTAKTPRLNEFKERQKEYQKRLLQRQIERSPQILASPFAKLTGGAV